LTSATQKLISRSLACWFGSRDAQSRAAIGIVTAMLFYNITAVVLFLSLRFIVGLSGMGLIPVSVVHATLAIWCFSCLRESR
jgi:hypothetical protein